MEAKNFQSLKLIYSDEVKKALDNNEPVVALESTIITHGMEYPHNLQTATAVENKIRENGATPATIVILNGEIHVGLSQEDLNSVAKGGNFIKCSTRDLPYVLMKKQNGSTTVAATMFIAALAGIKVFVTGGIGGVHFGNNMDISSDLIELSRTPVSVVCAGAKSILDIEKTLEYLETFCVPVVGFKTNKFPEFFFSEGDFDAKIKLDSEEECAEFIHYTHNLLNMRNGILFAVPVPKECEADKEKVKHAINQALDKAEKNNVKGSALTPMLLKEINNLTEGESCKANIALIINNAKHGAKIAVELVKKIKGN
jgi:pseudouridine-5'-phosphate glycosidase